eukprot:gene10528-10335_t
MNRVGKIVPPKRQILKDISLSFFPGAKIGVLGTNGSGKSTLLKIMAGIDKEIEGEAIPMAGLNIGYLPQEPQLDPTQTVRESVEAGMGKVFAAKARLEEVYTAYGAEDADFDALAAEQAELEAIIATAGTDSEHQLEIAADALRLPPWDANIGVLSGGEKRRWILELDRGSGIPYKGNYSDWLTQKGARLEAEQKGEEARAKALKKELEWSRQNPKARQAKSKARLARFEELSDFEYQKRNETNEIFIPVADRLGSQMAFVDQHRDDLSNDKTVWEDVSGGLDILNVGKFQMASRAYCGDSQWTFFDGNYQEYEADKKKRLGEEGAKPKRMRYKALK